MKNRNGFTLVELLVVIVVIGIIATATTLTYTKIQQQSRDSQRTASATIVAESLEKYFNTNGEYPPVSKITATDANTPKQLLGLNNLDNFIAPRSPAGTTTNLWKAGTATSTNKLTYTGNTDVSASCLTGVAATDVCNDYKIQYYLDKTDTVETINSRNKSLAPPAAPAAPAATTVSAVLSGTDVVATTTAAVCPAGSSIQYAFRSRTNDGTWSSYSAWDVVLTTSLPTAQGVKYGFQAKSQCINNGLTSPDSAVSNEATYIRPISTPAVTSLSNSTSGNTTTWAWPAVSCAAGTTAYYEVNSGNDYDTSGAQNWSFGYGADQTTLTWPRDTSPQGYNYLSVMRARCANANATSNWSSESNYSYYLRPVSAPGLASAWNYAVINSRATYRWWWTEPGCGVGTSRSWQWDGYVGDTNNTNGWNMYWLDKGPYYHYWYGADAPSKQDYGWYTGNILDLDLLGTSTPAGINVYAAITYRCINPNTLRSATGGRAQSPQNFT
jgi:prepilin-type N-terminal cleavage/methylation domain-containing protein